MVIKATERVEKAHETLRFPWRSFFLMFIFSELLRSKGHSLTLEMHEEENPVLQKGSHMMIVLDNLLACLRGDCLVPIRLPVSRLLVGVGFPP